MVHKVGLAIVHAKELLTLVLCIRAIKIDPDFGDGWAYFYKFELQHGTEVRPTLILVCSTAHLTRECGYDIRKSQTKIIFLND